MAINLVSNLGWHEGEQQMQNLLHVPPQKNPTSRGLTQYGSRVLQDSPLLALGTIDRDGRPWTTILGGQQGFAKHVGGSEVFIKTMVDYKYDPVMNIFFQGKNAAKAVYNKKLSGLTINLATRDRVKLAGRMVYNSIGLMEEDGVHKIRGSELQMGIMVDYSLGNCPKYLNKKKVLGSIPQPELISDSISLHESAVSLISKADLFFLTSSNNGVSLSTNHRGGSSGFVRVFVDDDSATYLLWPEYSGNRMYQSLGNLKLTPKAGLVFPNFDTGDVLYVTCTTDILTGKAASALLPRSNLIVKAKIDVARFVRKGLSFRAPSGEPSPYNPPVRFLSSERRRCDAQANNDKVVYAKLIKKEILTATIARLRFSVSDPEAAGRWHPGQYVALAFEDELSAGYSHMRDDDPMSLNDDYVRTFTVSSSMGHDLPAEDFEITMRNVGEVTRFLFRQQVRSGLEVPLKGFGGTFRIAQTSTETIPFIAGGIGITPILAHLPHLDLQRIKLFWALNVQDIGLVMDTFRRHPALTPSTVLFVSGIKDDTDAEAQVAVAELERSQASVLPRHMEASDIHGYQDVSSMWYICTGTALRRSLLLWLSGKHVEYEDFNY